MVTMNSIVTAIATLIIGVTTLMGVTPAPTYTSDTASQPIEASPQVKASIMGGPTYVRDIKVNRQIIVSHDDNPNEYRSCTAAFAAYQGQLPVIVTAGHCFPYVGKQVEKFGEVIAYRNDVTDFRLNDSSKFDYGIFAGVADNSLGADTHVTYEDGKYHSGDSSQIDRVETPTIGRRVCSYGNTSGWRCGVINRVEDNYFVASMGASAGDSGGGAYADGAVLGMLSATTTTSDGKTASYFQRADVVMEREGLSIR